MKKKAVKKKKREEKENMKMTFMDVNTYIYVW